MSQQGTVDQILTIQAPSIAGELAFTDFAGKDEISRCFAFTVAFSSPELAVDPLDMLGQRISLAPDPENDPRWFDGLVVGFRMTGIETRRAQYEAELRPWLWFLGKGRDCRIFQRMSVVEIIEEVFSAYPEAKFDKRLQGIYPPRDYCVQYDESDLDFVQRLMEHEGIFYYFEHAQGSHTLVLADALSALSPAEGCEVLPFTVVAEGYARDASVIWGWSPSSVVRPGAYSHTGYDFKKPAADLMARSEHAFRHEFGTAEVYSHPGAHIDLGRGDAIAEVRREELQAAHQRVRAEGNARGLAPGTLFTLEGFPRQDQNAEHLVISAEYNFGDLSHRARTEAGGKYRVVLEAAPSALPYRPPRRTPRPIMRGPQTATVVGPGGEEIFTDEFARVKVQFHWDRQGKRDQDSSCFVRVSQTWAGAGWGFIQIPRIGQEVIVDFIEGDPDQPIITGRVYNANEPAPYGLPGSATQSGWKSNSSPGGGGYNELMFEDAAGKELVNFQAQKDHTLLVKNDRTKLVQHDQSDRIDNNAKHSVGVDLDEDVGNNKTTSVGVDRTVKIGSNDTESVGVDRSLTVGSNETISIGANSTETIGANHSQTVAQVQTVTVGGARVDTVGMAEARTVGAAQVNTIGAVRQVSVGLSQSHDVGTSDSWNVGSDQSVTVGGGQNSEIGKTRTAKVGADDSTEVTGQHALKIGKDSLIQVGENSGFVVGKNLTIEAKDAITIKCGSAEILMKKDGSITIRGKGISVDDKGDTSIEASGKITMKGPSGINQN